MRLEPSTVTGPRLLKLANVLLMSIAPVENEAAYIAGGSVTVLHPDPLLPADASTKMPAAWADSTEACSVLAAQVSLVGQPQLLFITCGRSAGLGLLPVRSVGATKNWKQPM